MLGKRLAIPLIAAGYRMVIPVTIVSCNYTFFKACPSHKIASIELANGHQQALTYLHSSCFLKNTFAF